jgi:hypothetical protein
MRVCSLPQSRSSSILHSVRVLCLNVQVEFSKHVTYPLTGLSPTNLDMIGLSSDLQRVFNDVSLSQFH